MTSDEKFLSRIVSLGGLVDAAILLGLTATWIGLLGELWWFFDLFAHFRLQYFGICIFGLAWFVWWTNRLGIAASLVSLLLNAGLYFGLFSGVESYQAASDFHLRAVSINVKTSNRSVAKVIDFIRQADADVVLLMEINKRWENALLPLKKMYPHSVFEPRQDNFGVAFLSRIEVVSSEIEMFADPADPFDMGVPAPVVAVKHAGRMIRVIGVHPIPPSGADNSRWRNDELSRMAEMTRKSQEPVLLIGDLNATPWSAGMRILTGESNLRLPPSRFARSPSWMVDSPLAIPIDHALASPPLVVLNRKVGPDVGSDHRPIIVEVGWIQTGSEN